MIAEGLVADHHAPQGEPCCVSAPHRRDGRIHGGYLDWIQRFLVAAPRGTQRERTMSLRAAWLWFAASALLVAATFFAPCARGEDEPEALGIEASVVVPLSQFPLTRITIAPDGATRIVQAGSTADEDAVTLTFRLTSEEMARAREAVVAARFFEPWGPRSIATDQPTWHVTVRLGDRALEREKIYAEPEFEPLGRHLMPFARQARMTAELRRGDFALARSILCYRFDAGVAHPVALVEEVVACATRIEDAKRCAAAARLLACFPDVKDWVRGAEDLLSRLEGDRRGAVLWTWATDLRMAERADHRAAFTPLALAEVAAEWRRWPAMSVQERAGVGALLAMLLRDGRPQAFEIAESMAGTFGTPDEPFVPEGLLATGEEAVPVVLRLLGAPEPGARASGAKMAYVQISVVRRRMGLGEDLPEDVLTALERRFGAEVVPALERRVQDPAESYAVRKTCLAALDRWDGRVEAAKAEAREAEAAAAAERKRQAAERERTASPPPPPTGTLVIAGRLLGPSDVPLPGFEVYALTGDGRPAGHALVAEDGSFHLDGLAAGTYDVVCVGPGEGLGGLRRAGPPIATGVLAGAADLLLHLPGSLIRGRVIDAAGEPVVGQRVVAQMRDPPSEQGATCSSAMVTTNADGRFLFLRLIPGLYDLSTPGWLALQGADGIETGPEERTVRRLDGAAIAGRVVDETGAPLAGVFVSLSEAGTGWNTLQGVQTSGEGTFRLVHLAPSHDYKVGAALGGPPQRGAVAESVASGTEDLVLRIDTRPHLCFSVDFGDRGNADSKLRVERIDGGPPLVRDFRGSPVKWAPAPPGTWRVLARVRDMDANGVVTYPWVEVGTVTTGEPSKTLVVPR